MNSLIDDFYLMTRMFCSETLEKDFLFILSIFFLSQGSLDELDDEDDSSLFDWVQSCTL